MKILWVITGLAGGGAERVLADLASGSVEAGHTSVVVTHLPAGPDDYCLGPGVRRVCTGLGIVQPGPGQVPALGRRLWALRQAVRREQPQLVVSFLAETNQEVLLASRGLGVPVLVAERSDPLDHALAGWRQFARRRLYPLAAKVVVQSDHLAATMARLVPAARLAVLPNPVDCSRFQPAAFAPPQVVVAVGSLRRVKGFDLLLHAWARLAADLPGWTLQIVGEGPDRAALVALADRLAVADRVQFSGRCRDMPACYQRAAVFALPSRSEGMPNALLEAMASGLPVVSTAFSPWAESTVAASGAGLVVPVADVEALAAALRSLCQEPARRAACAAQARRQAEAQDRPAVLHAWLTCLVEAAEQGC